MTVYNYIIAIVGLLATLAVAVGLGHYVTRRVNIATEYRRVGETITIGSAIGVLISGAPIPLGMQDATSVDTATGFLLVAAVVRMLVEVALLVTVGAIAGAAIVMFRTDEERPGTPTDTGDSPSTVPPKSTQRTNAPNLSLFANQ